jgi:membrane-bound metal-dependent hydrolase YbcI (DUF457 family)
MKGITHFAAGVAAASCFPYAVEAGASGNPLYFLLGGCCGLLPDTLDFKFSRFFHRHDMEVAPDPENPDAQMLADAVALAVNTAHADGRPIRLKLDTIRLGADSWQRYEVTFNVRARRVEVAYGPVVDSGQQETGERRRLPPAASSPLDCGIKLDYMATTVIDILDGPSFRMTPADHGTVEVGFQSWHRAWSHSLTIGLLAALLAARIWDLRAGWVAFSGYSAHVAVDQLGFMGSNLFYPFTSRRLHGLRLVHSGSSFPNSIVIWFCGLLVFWNLSRATAGIPPGNPVALLFYGLLLPVLVHRFFVFLRERKP